MEAGPWGARRGLVLRSGLSVGIRKFADHLQKPRDCSGRPSEKLLHRRLRFEDRQAGMEDKARRNSVVGYSHDLPGSRTRGTYHQRLESHPRLRSINWKGTLDSFAKL